MPNIAYRNPAFGAGISNLAEAFLGNPQAAGQLALQKAQTDSANAQTGLYGTKTERQNLENEALSGLASAFAAANQGVSPETAALYGTSVRAGLNPREFGQGNLAGAATNPAVSIGELMRLSAGAGSPVGVNEAVTLGQRNQGVLDTQANKLAQIFAEQEAKKQFGTGTRPKTYAVAPRTRDDLVNDFEEALGIDENNGLPDDIVTVGTEAYRQTGDAQAAINAVIDFASKNYTKTDNAFFDDTMERNAPAAIQTNTSSPVGWGIKRIR